MYKGHDVSCPILQKKLSIKLPEEMIVNFDIHNKNDNLKYSEQKENKYIIYNWQAEDLPFYKREGFFQTFDLTDTIFILLNI